MNYSKHFDKYGTLPTFRLEDEPIVNNGKPSSFIFKNKKKYQKTLKILKDIEEKHNHSWYEELRQRTEVYQNEDALFYRGKIYSYNEMIAMADRFANALYNIGVRKGDNIGCCVSNIPESIFLMLALNKIGAKFCCFNGHLPSSADCILENASEKIFVMTDDSSQEVFDKVLNKNFNKILIFSLADSLPKSKDLINDYIPELDEFYHFENKVNHFKKQNDNVIDLNEFLKYYNEKTEVIDDNTLDTEFLVTMTSGTSGQSKILTHKNRSIMTSGIFSAPEYSDIPPIKKSRSLSLIGYYSNTGIISTFADEIISEYCVALEPIYNPDFLFTSIRLNNVHLVGATSSFCVNIAEKYLNNEYVDKNKKLIELPNLLVLIALGEPLQVGQEHTINKFLKKCNAGKAVKIKNITLPVVYVSVGGGTTEHGGFRTLFANFVRIKHPFKCKKKEQVGILQQPYAMTSSFKINKNGLYEECNYNEIGILAIKTPTSLAKYNNFNTKDIIIKTANGDEWLKIDSYGYIDTLGYVHMTGRLQNNKNIEKISNYLNKNYKHINFYYCFENDKKCYIFIQEQNYVNRKKIKNKIIKILNMNEDEFDKHYKIIFSKINYKENLTMSGKFNFNNFKKNIS